MSALADNWDQYLGQVGADGVRARRIFCNLTSSGASNTTPIEEAVAGGMLPVLSFKVPDPNRVMSGDYDAWMKTLRTQLVDLNVPVTATFWHEPRTDMDPAVFRAASNRFFDLVNAPSIDIGPILNGWLLDNRSAEFATYTDSTLLSKWEFVAVDSYQDGSPSAPGTLLPARAAPLLADWMDQQGYPDKPLGIGEYNGFSASTMAAGGEFILSTPEVAWGLVWNSTGGKFTPLADDRITAFKNTKADPRALR